MVTLFVFTVPGSLELSRADLLGRGIPEKALISRSLRDAIRCSVADEPGWAAAGPAAGMALTKDGSQVGEIKISGQEWEITWDHLACRKATLSTGDMEDLAHYWREGVEYHLEAIAGPDVRRVLDRLLAELPEVNQTLLPGLRWVPAAHKPMVYRIHELLPEVLFWAQDAPQAPPGPPEVQP